MATPIGNLADISFRAVETLKNVDLIACEDTRHTRKLLNHYGISNRLISYHKHNERERAAELLTRLERGDSVAVVSDAGTPGINDPGHVIVRQAVEAGFAVVPVPGPVAYVAAVIVSGLPTDSIFFGGFLPSRQGERRKRLAQVKEIPATLVFYDSPHRIARSLSDCLEILGDRAAAVVRELTKIHEEAIYGTLKELTARVSNASVRGEFVLVIDRARQDIGQGDGGGFIAERVTELEASGMDPKAALKAAAKEFGISRSEAYRRLQAFEK